MGARLNAGEQVGGGLGSHAFFGFFTPGSRRRGGGEGFECQTKEVGRRLHEAFINEHVDDFFAQTVNPHGAASSEMHNGKLHLRGTDEAARAAHVFFFFIPNDSTAADRADMRHLENLGACRPALFDDAQNLRNDVARPAQHNSVAHAQVEVFDHMIFIVERCVGNRDAAHIDRRQTCDRREPAGAAHLHVNAEHLGEHLFGRIFVRARPARFSGNEAKLFFEFETVDFIDHAVDFKGKRRTSRRNFVVEGGECFGPLDDLAHVRNGKPQLCETVQYARLRLSKGFRDFAQTVGIEVKGTLSRYARVQLAQRSGSGVARVGKRFFAGCFLSGIEGQKVGLMHDAFAANFQNIGHFAVETKRNGADRADIGRHVFALNAVAASGGFCQDAFFITQIGRETVELQFAVVFDGRVFRRKAQS